MKPVFRAKFLSAFFAAAVPCALPLALSGCAVSGYSQLSGTKQADVKRIETYLNNLHSLEASFAQNGLGSNQQGDGHFVYVPGALRMDYEIPAGLLVLAHDEKLMMIDSKSEAVTQLSLKKNPLGYLLRHPLNFNENVEVSDVRYGSDTVQISLAQADNPSQGLLTLQFSDVRGKLSLVGIRGTDAQHRHFGLSLYDVHENVPVSKEIFTFPSN
ncbi:outer membrane lipoprotein carrier protein LolA [Aristophania vespae]|uniref:Outer membrane lipoprotein carrier protein LolA n=1 Tax=Aristophania vespae TaxID=2697033 RepID=A0A6P1NGN0_9PROT|nr:outer membrane lipoprotein carrier protein LolA [Aristophania vespae]QHI95680.1 outer membrane lipoprotein carrier protein LolA [Aristophania vespae]UMM63367.1 hypothetical protein DM15PD_03270 [Aristophania vespae]